MHKKWRFLFVNSIDSNSIQSQTHWTNGQNSGLYFVRCTVFLSLFIPLNSKYYWMHLLQCNIIMIIAKNHFHLANFLRKLYWWQYWIEALSSFAGLSSCIQFIAFNRFNDANQSSMHLATSTVLRRLAFACELYARLDYWLETISLIACINAHTNWLLSQTENRKRCKNTQKNLHVNYNMIGRSFGRLNDICILKATTTKNQ